MKIALCTELRNVEWFESRLRSLFDGDGQLAIDEPDAEIVHRIFQMRAEGRSLGAISDWLFEYKIPSPSGRERWSRETTASYSRMRSTPEMCCFRRHS